MQVTIPIVATPKSVLFAQLKEQENATHLVSHWLKDKEGKLYQMWVSERI